MRLLLIAVTLLLAALAGVLALLYLRQRELIYFPAYTRVDPRQTDFALHRENVTLRGWVVNRGSPGAILYFGGNAERVEASREDFARWFPDAAVYLMAYRGYGASDGTPNEEALASDAVALYDHVRDRHPGAPINVIGRSLGSGVAARLASQRPVERLALVTPFDSLIGVARVHYPWAPVDWLMRERYESARHLSAYGGRMLVVRAGRDRIVPPASTARLVASLASPPEVVVLAQADHNDISGYPEYGEALAAFVR